MYTVITKEATFMLTRTSESNLCGYKLTHTEHTKFFILKIQLGRTNKRKTRIATDNMDMLTYFNSKFVYMERHFCTQLTTLYKDIMIQKCAIERQVLENALLLFSIAPDEMAFRVMKTPGYTAVTAGKVIYVIKCIPVICKVRPTDACYNELPVTYNNHSYFLASRSRILSRKGSHRDCNELLPVMYQLDDAWYLIMPKPVEFIPPHIIQPLTQPCWKYVSPANLAGSGIYSSKDLDRLKDIMFPIEKSATLNIVAKGATVGHPRWKYILA